MFTVICAQCQSNQVEVQKSINGVFFECENGHQAELTYDMNNKPVWEDYS
ncbi:hypothetical protein ACFVS2_20510 [Brevibacillus sp. NPDC058079]